METVNLQEAVCAFIITSRRILLKMGNASPSNI